MTYNGTVRSCAIAVITNAFYHSHPAWLPAACCMLPDTWLEGQTLVAGSTATCLANRYSTMQAVAYPCRPAAPCNSPKPMLLKVIIFQAPQPAQQLACAPAAAQLAFWAVSYMPYTHHTCITISRA